MAVNLEQLLDEKYGSGMLRRSLQEEQDAEEEEAIDAMIIRSRERDTVAPAETKSFLTTLQEKEKEGFARAREDATKIIESTPAIRETATTYAGQMQPLTPEMQQEGMGRAERAIQQVPQILETIGKQQQEIYQQEGEAQKFGVKGLGETALQLGTGLVGGGVGIMRATEDALRGIPDASDPNYWKKFTDTVRRVGSEFTYQPRTEEGKAIGETIVNPAMEALQRFSEGASQAPLMRMIFTEDQRHAVAYAHELLTMVALGEIGGSVLGRRKTEAFKREFSKAAQETAGKTEPSTVSNTEILTSAAEEIITAAEKNPEIMNKLELAQGINPRLIPSLRTRGKEVLERLSENPDNIEYQNQGAAFFESTRSVRDTTVQQLRNDVGNTINIGEVTKMPRADRVARLREMQRNTTPTDPVDRWMITKEESTLAPPQREFATSKGSKYQIAEDGTTVRNKSYHPEHGPEDVGLQPRSSRTYYVTEEQANRLSEIQTRGGRTKSIEEIGDGRIGIQYEDGTFERRTVVTPERGPKEGLHPLEIFEDGATHFGNKITSITETMNRGEVSSMAELDVADISPTPALRATRKQRNYAKERYTKVTPEEEANFTKGLEESTIEKVSKMEPDQIAKLSADDKIEVAQEKARIFTSKEETLAKLQSSLETGKDLSADIFRETPSPIEGDFAVMKYQKAMEVARKGIKGSENRRLGEILSDIVELFAFDVDPNSLGSSMANISLSHRQKMAAQRLLAEARKSKEDLNTLINDTISDPDVRMTYRTYLDSISDSITPSLAVPKNMRLDADAMLHDPPIKRRVRDNGGDAPPVYESEARAVQDAPVAEGVMPKYIETPIRGARRFGEPIMELTQYPYRRIKDSTSKELTIMREDLNRLRDLAGYKSRKNISEYAFEGRGSLTPKEERVINTLEVGIGSTLDRVNATRVALGYEEIPTTTDPLTFARTIQAIKESGGHTNLITASLEELNLKLAKGGGINFPKTTTQKLLKLSPEKDIFQIFNDFNTGAIEQIRLAPLTEKLRELYGSNLPDVNSTKPDVTWSMREKNPPLYDYLSKWTEFVEGKDNFYVGKSLGVDWDRMIGTLRENTAFSLLAYSGSSISAQPFSLVHTMHRTSLKDVAAATKMSLESVIKKGSGERAIALGESQVLSGRNEISVYADWVESASRGKLGDALRLFGQDIKEGRLRDATRTGARIGMWPMEAMDLESAIISYNAGKLQGKRMGLTGDALIKHADNVVVETQGSGWRGDLSPIQRNSLAKMFTQFQTFAISDANYVFNDVLKIDKNATAKERVASIAKLVTIVSTINTVLDYGHDLTGLPISSPLPNPIKAVRQSLGRGDSVFKTAANAFFQTVAPYTPVIGGSRYGKGIGGPVIGKMFVDIPRSLGGSPGAPELAEPISELAGTPGSGTFWRMVKPGNDGSLTERIMDLTEKFMNFRDEEEESGGRLSSGLKRRSGQRLRGLR